MKLYKNLHAKQIHNKIQTNMQKFPTFGFWYVSRKSFGTPYGRQLFSVYKSRSMPQSASDAHDTSRPLHVMILVYVLYFQPDYEYTYDYQAALDIAKKVGQNLFIFH